MPACRCWKSRACVHTRLHLSRIIIAAWHFKQQVLVLLARVAENERRKKLGRGTLLVHFFVTHLVLPALYSLLFKCAFGLTYLLAVYSSFFSPFASLVLQSLSLSLYTPLKMIVWFLLHTPWHLFLVTSARCTVQNIDVILRWKICKSCCEILRLNLLFNFHTVINFTFFLMCRSHTPLTGIESHNTHTQTTRHTMHGAQCLPEETWFYCPADWLANCQQHPSRRGDEM